LEDFDAAMPSPIEVMTGRHDLQGQIHPALPSDQSSQTRTPETCIFKPAAWSPDIGREQKRGREAMRNFGRSLWFVRLMKHMALFSVLFCLTVTALPAREGALARTLDYEPKDESRDRSVPVRVYLPAGEPSCPVILFSHGLGGSRENNPYLGSHWAANGYVAVFIQHHGSDAEVWKSVAPAERMSALKEAASAKSAIARIADVPFVIDQLEKWNVEEGHPLFGKFDLEHIGMSGHSFGAGTTQAMMGEVFPRGLTAAEPRIDAFVAFSPSISKRVEPAVSFGKIDRPALLMTGTKDGSPIDSSLTPQSRMQVYAAMPAGDKYHLVFEGAEHHAFGDSGRKGQRGRIAHHHPAIQKISTLFWDAYLKQDAEAKAALQSDSVRDKAGLVEKDVWEWK
jgi:predicted dienelactone hydrolase